MSTSSYRPNGSQPVAGPSKPTARHLNPQLSSEPWFAYPTPPPDVVDAELPPYVESENVPMGVMLDRLARSAHVHMGSLVQDTLPKLDPRQRPKVIIGYAKHTRQSVLKYLAVLRWKLQVDIPTILPVAEGQQQPSFPTPHSNGDSYSPAAPGIKGKGKMTEEDVKVSIRGKVTDAKRIAEYMKHQNDQHDMAVSHVRHTATNIETLRVRNPDLLTALSLLTTGTYNRLPTDITESFVPRPILTNASILDTLRRLDAHILYRLRCVDYVPPDIRIDKIQDGRAYVTGGKGQWHAEISLTGFGTGMQGRYWLTGVEWGWRIAGEDGRESLGKRFKGNERQQILDLVNREILPPEDAGHDPSSVLTADAKTGVELGNTPQPGDTEQLETKAPAVVDAPLVRLVNFIQHLSLTYQLEVLFAQAMALSREKWRGHLLVDIDRTKKSLTLKYWIRPRIAPTVQVAGQKRVGPAPPAVNMRTPMVGATITISIGEAEDAQAEADLVQKAISECDAAASERVLTLGLRVKWEIGEAGFGGGWKAGDSMDITDLRLDPTALSIEDILLPATRSHAAHLVQIHAAPLIANSTRLMSPTLESKPMRPITLYVPVPARRRQMDLSVSVSHITGRIEIEDEGAKFSAGSGGDERANRTRQATYGVNAGSTPLGEALRRLVIAIYTDGLEGQMRQLGWTPSRKLPIKLGELAEHGLVPASTIFVPLPTSDLHFLVVRITPDGVVFELLRIARVPAENGIGLKLAVKDREPMDLNRLRQRRLAADRKRKAPGQDLVPETTEPQAFGFEVDTRDLKDLFIFSNALVAQMLVEQQLKDRSIPYVKRYPEATGPSAPLSSSAVAGMIPTIKVETENLLQDHRAAEVAMPHVFLQLKDWWKGGKCQVVTIVRLKHQTSTSTAGASPGLNDASTSSAARAEGISFDQASSVVKFTAKDISRCVQAFLEQWERLSKVIMVAGDVNRLNKLSVFRDLRMLSFDLRTATFSYSPGFNASITYSSTSDSYECTFMRSSPVNTPGTPATVSAEASPHEVLGPLLSHKLNDLTRSEDVKKGTVGREFITLLRNTLPLLLEIESIRARSTSGYPELVISAVDQYRLVWDVERTKRFAIDITLLPDDRYLIIDASSPSPDGLVDLSCGTLTPLPDFSTAIDNTYESLRTAQAGEMARGVLAVKVDQGQSLAVRVSVIGEVVRGLCNEISAALVEGVRGKSE